MLQSKYSSFKPPFDEQLLVTWHDSGFLFDHAFIFLSSLIECWNIGSGRSWVIFWGNSYHMLYSSEASQVYELVYELVSSVQTRETNPGAILVSVEPHQSWLVLKYTISRLVIVSHVTCGKMVRHLRFRFTSEVSCFWCAPMCYTLFFL